MHAYPAYRVSDILQFTVRNYFAMRQHVTRLKDRDIADGIRGAFYAQTKNPRDIINIFDPPRGKDAR